MKELLEENPQAKRYFCKWSAFWGLAMVLSFVVCQAGHYLSLIMIPAFLFGFLHGQGQLMVEDYLLIKADSSKIFFAIYLFLTAVVVLLEAEIQYLLRNVERLSNHMGGIPIGLAIDREYAFFQLIILLLIVWMIKKAVTVSMQYLLDVVYAVGGDIIHSGCKKLSPQYEYSYDRRSDNGIFVSCIILWNRDGNCRCFENIHKASVLTRS